MRTLYGLTQSAWTEKARWALDHHGIAYRYHEHVPLLGEGLLRMKARRRPPGTKASVPLLVDGSEVFPSSLAIAKHADRTGRGTSLLPKGQEEAVERWADLSDRLITIGRSAVLEGLRKNKEAQREALPAFIPGPLRGVLSPMTVAAAMFLASKHDVPRDAEAEGEKLRPLLDEVRSALAGRSHLVGGLTFADIAVASALTVLRPRADAPIGPGTRQIWSNERVAADYEDLLAWRDRLYREHRHDP